MSVLKYLFAVWAGVLIYTLLAFSFGSRGISAYNQLLGEKTRQEANIESLRQKNLALENSMNALLHDEDTLAVFARELGYARTQQRFVRIVGLGGYQQTLTDAGVVLYAVESHHIPDRILQIIAFFAAIAIFLCMLFFDAMKRVHKS
ncbi:MAG: septum formation initiator family protein [Treponema sp.]|jgi:cell division protein FtsB|nr:septum formation initiator family protein [Treponema sp.]